MYEIIIIDCHECKTANVLIDGGDYLQCMNCDYIEI